MLCSEHQARKMNIRLVRCSQASRNSSAHCTFKQRSMPTIQQHVQLHHKRSHCTVVGYLRCTEIRVKVVVILPLPSLAGEQRLVMRSMHWNSCIRLVPARPYALLHMRGTNAWFTCKPEAAVLRVKFELCNHVMKLLDMRLYAVQQDGNMSLRLDAWRQQCMTAVRMPNGSCQQHPITSD